jgi:hypothetical protein
LIAQPDQKVVPWLEAIQHLRNSESIAFALELCGSQDGGDRHTGVFEILGKKLWSLVIKPESSLHFDLLRGHFSRGFSISVTLTNCVAVCMEQSLS